MSHWRAAVAAVTEGEAATGEAGTGEDTVADIAAGTVTAVVDIGEAIRAAVTRTAARIPDTPAAMPEEPPAVRTARCRGER